MLLRFYNQICTTLTIMLLYANSISTYQTEQQIERILKMILLILSHHIINRRQICIQYFLQLRHIIISQTIKHITHHTIKILLRCKITIAQHRYESTFHLHIREIQPIQVLFRAKVRIFFEIRKYL